MPRQPWMAAGSPIREEKPPMVAMGNAQTVKESPLVEVSLALAAENRRLVGAPADRQEIGPSSVGKLVRQTAENPLPVGNSGLLMIESLPRVENARHSTVISPPSVGIAGQAAARSLPLAGGAGPLAAIAPASAAAGVPMATAPASAARPVPSAGRKSPWCRPTACRHGASPWPSSAR